MHTLKAIRLFVGVLDIVRIKGKIDILFFLFILLITSSLIAQPGAESINLDSIKHLLSATRPDTTRVNLLIDLANTYTFSSPDQGRQFASDALSLAKDLSYIDGQIRSLSSLSFGYSIRGEWARGLDFAFQGIQLAKDHQPESEFIFASVVAVAYQKQKDYKKILEWTLKPLHSKQFLENNQFGHWSLAMMSSFGFMETGIMDSALYYAIESLNTAKNGALPKAQAGYSYGTIGNVYLKNEEYDSSRVYFQRARNIMMQIHNDFAVQELNRDLAKLYDETNQKDSVLKYATLALDGAIRINNVLVVQDVTALLADYYEPLDRSKALHYLRMHTMITDSLSTVEKANQVYQLEWEERRKAIELENERQSHQSKIRQNTLLGSLTTVVLIAVVVFYNSRQKQKANKLLASQKAELESALTNLKSAQSRLVQSEKMASLGELTAGIAHEIQNPLNFVNNFSEVSNELIDELVEEANKGNFDDARRIANDVKQNLEKVSQHGKRADGIVKSMLQHSQSGSGKLELTDINQLCDECLRLSYHGLRAKDKSFNAKFETYFDLNLEKINVVPQEIGRVVLNLINNAFYAATEKKKNNLTGFDPTISITTKKQGDKIEISVKDNGTGIPQNILDKIFQPFFTTKPTGQGTGLGLSLSYDIIKAHNGEIKVLTEEGKGTTFIVLLPIS